MRSRSVMVSLLAFFLGAGNASAAVFCAATTSSIQQALAIAGSNGEADSIRIVIGNYAPTAGSIAFSYSTNEGNALSIEGGYTFGCGARVDKASLTVLGGSGMRQVMRLYAQGGGAISVKNLTIENGNAPTRGAGLSVEGPTGPFFVGFTGNVTVERVIFLGNRSTAAPGGLAIATRGGNIVVRGNLLAFNRCGEDNCALWIENRADDPITVLFGGNTVALNTCILGTSCDSGGARFLGEQNAVIYNNLFAFHSGADLSLQNPAVTANLYYNNIEVLIGSTDTEIGTVNVANPQFIDALAEDFHLLSTSPLRNLGNAPFPLPSVDLDGNPRIVESAPELGAYEIFDFLFVDGFDS